MSNFNENLTLTIASDLSKSKERNTCMKPNYKITLYKLMRVKNFFPLIYNKSTKQVGT